MSKDKTFLALKNIIHNELKITRAEIMEIVRDCIHDVVERQVQSAIKNHPDTMNDRLTLAMDKRATSMVKTCEWVTKNKIYEELAKRFFDQVDIDFFIESKTKKSKEKPDGCTCSEWPRMEYSCPVHREYLIDRR